MSILEKMEKFKADELQKLVNQCTGLQQDLFYRLYPNGVPEEKLIGAIQLCERTIKNNSKIDKE